MAKLWPIFLRLFFFSFLYNPNRNPIFSDADANNPFSQSREPQFPFNGLGWPALQHFRMLLVRRGEKKTTWEKWGLAGKFASPHLPAWSDNHGIDQPERARQPHRGVPARQLLLMFIAQLHYLHLLLFVSSTGWYLVRWEMKKQKVCWNIYGGSCKNSGKIKIHKF